MAPALLLVEDDASNRQLLELYLGRHGFTVISAADGESALELEAKHSPDLVLLDVMMPGLSGMDVLVQLRKRKSEVELPIVMATALTDSEHVVEALQAGANDYVTKPYDLRVLLARLQARLRIDQRPKASGQVQRHKVAPGTLLAERYALEDKIGAGASGDVYAARHMELDNPVAVKVLRLPEDNERRVSLLERFRREGISACRVKHPNVVTVLDAGVTPEGVAYLVMERLIGRALDQEIRGRAPLSPARAAQLLLPVCYVLAEAHAANVIHRDIKPANIFVHQSKRGEVVKVLDFGIARLMDDGSDVAARDRIVGSPAYMAPERFRNLPHDGRADVYSLGVILFEMLAGTRPFGSATEDPVEVARKHLKEPPPPLTSLRAELPRDLVALVEAALEKDPASRPSPEVFALRLSSAVNPRAS